MRTMKWLLGTSLAAALALPLAPAHAGEKGAPPAQIQALDRLLGKWRGSGSVRAGSEQATLRVTWDCAKVALGFGVGCTMRIRGVPGVPLVEEVDVFGYDVASGRLQWATTCNSGEAHAFHGTMTNDVLSVRDDTARVTVRFAKPRVLELRWVSGPEAKPAYVFEAKLTR